jgi:hypothetical protein
VTRRFAARFLRRVLSDALLGTHFYCSLCTCGRCAVDVHIVDDALLFGGDGRVGDMGVGCTSGCRDTVGDDPCSRGHGLKRNRGHRCGHGPGRSSGRWPAFASLATTVCRVFGCVGRQPLDVWSELLGRTKSFVRSFRMAIQVDVHTMLSTITALE